MTDRLLLAASKVLSCALQTLGDVHAGYHTTAQHVNDIAAQQF